MKNEVIKTLENGVLMNSVVADIYRLVLKYGEAIELVDKEPAELTFERLKVMIKDEKLTIVEATIRINKTIGTPIMRSRP